MKTIRTLFYFGIILMVLLSGCNPLNQETPLPEMSTATQLPEVNPATPLPEKEMIAEIQGAGHISPLVNQPVTNVHGIVTVVRADGFYMQSVIADEDPATSEGIFVFTELVPEAKMGDEVVVDAVVEEMVPGGVGTDNLSITQLEDPEIEILSSGNDLPAPIIIGEGGRLPPDQVIDDDTEGFVTESNLFDPGRDGLDFYESVEGMRIQVNQALVVGATNRYKEIVIVGDMGAHAGVRTPRGGIVIQPDDFNPERIILDDLLVEMPFVETGDYSIDPIIGVVDYDYGNFKILPTDKINFTSGGLAPAEPLSPAEAGQVRVVSYNVENLSANDPNRVLILAGHIVNLMASPDIIGLQEIQDNNGSPNADGVAADMTYQGIIDAVLALGGPEYGYANINPKAGNDGGISGGNIRVGFLYRLDTGLTLANAPHGDAITAVEILEENGKPTLSLNPGRIDPTNAAFIESRKPLAVEFIFGDKSIFIINNHFNSKGEDTPLFGDIQPPVLESEIQRILEAKIVHDFVAELLAMDPDAQVIVMGDLNDFQFSPPIELLEGEILNNLIETLPIEEQYTYVYDGNSQVLDHILVSESLMGRLAEFDILHINSEFDYEQRFSDHDILITTFTFK